MLNSIIQKLDDVNFKIIYTKHSKGFTLVELSIVLVAIGLLISGILIGQTLINSSKINSQIIQLQQYTVAAQSFKTKYKQLPGDCLICDFPKAAKGNGDGFIGVIASAPTACLGWAGNECQSFFGHLAKMGGIKYGNEWQYAYTPTEIGPTPHWIYINDGTGYSMSFPKVTLGTNNALQVSQNVGGPIFWGIWKTSASLRNIEPKDVMALDSKIDDGIANAGDVATTCGWGTGTGYPFGVCNTSNSTCVKSTDASKYNTASDTGCGVQINANIN